VSEKEKNNFRTGKGRGGRNTQLQQTSPVRTDKVFSRDWKMKIERKGEGGGRSQTLPGGERNHSLNIDGSGGLWQKGMD